MAFNKKKCNFPIRLAKQIGKLHFLKLILRTYIVRQPQA